MKKRLAAAIVGVTMTFLGGAAITLAGEGVANASEIVTVCNREVLGPDGWACVESTTCVYESWGDWVCDDGTSGGPEHSGTPVPIHPIQS